MVQFSKAGGTTVSHRSKASGISWLVPARIKISTYPSHTVFSLDLNLDGFTITHGKFLHSAPFV